MKRGEVWTVSDTGYAGKPRPAVIVQSNQFEDTASVTLCSFTSGQAEADYVRPLIVPDGQNGLLLPSRLMIDKITTVPRTKLGRMLGTLSHEDMNRVNSAIVIHLDLT